MAFDKETTTARTPASEPVPPPPPSERAKMVGWYDPGQLAKTGVDVALSTIFGRFADHRLIEALAPPTSDFYDYSVHCSINDANEIVSDTGSPRSEIWIDYAADVGDGWNSTYAIAYHLSRPQELRDSQGKPHQTSAGALLLFGGDEVYPVAERDLYLQHLVAPYEAARQYSQAPQPPCLRHSREPRLV